MNLTQMSIEELVELRTKMILEKKNIKEINSIIESKEREYVEYIMEDTLSSTNRVDNSKQNNKVVQCYSKFIKKI